MNKLPILSVIALCGLLATCEAQVVETDPNLSTGTPTSLKHVSKIDTIDFESGNLNLSIPLLNLKGRGLDTNFVLSYNSKMWSTYHYPGDQFVGPYDDLQLLSLTNYPQTAGQS